MMHAVGLARSGANLDIVRETCLSSISSEKAAYSNLYDVPSSQSVRNARSRCLAPVLGYYQGSQGARIALLHPSCAQPSLAKVLEPSPIAMAPFQHRIPYMRASASWVLAETAFAVPLYLALAAQSANGATMFGWG